MLINPRIWNNRVKKIESNVDNCPGFSERRYQMICQIQKYLKEGCSYREIARRMRIGRNTIAKYREGDPKELSMYGIRQSKLDPFYDFIIQCEYSGLRDTGVRGFGNRHSGSQKTMIPGMETIHTMP